MAGKFYHRNRLRNSLISSAALVLAIAVLRVPWEWKLLVALVGLGLGYLHGVYDWKKAEARVDARNVVILYFEDTGYYVIIFWLYLLSLQWAARFYFIRFIKAHPTEFQLLILLVVALWSAYSIAFYRGVKAFEVVRGPLRVKRFHARSVTGSEGLIGKEAMVIEACTPSGRVKLGPETWSAGSIDKTPIAVGTRVVIRDVEGLEVFVEASEAKRGGVPSEATGAVTALFAIGSLGLGLLWMANVLGGSYRPNPIAAITFGAAILLGVFLAVSAWRLLTGRRAAVGGGVLSPLAWTLTGLVFFGFAGLLVWVGGPGAGIVSACFGVLCFVAARVRARSGPNKTGGRR